MTQLDRHIRHAQNKLTLGQFAEWVARTVLVAGLAVWAGIVVERLCHIELRGGRWWLTGIAAAAVVAAIVVAALRRPTPLDAAVAIDDRLGLKEKLSTALYARGSSDPFARAAVADAENAAGSAVLAKQFPIRYPRRANAAIAVAIAAILTAWLLPSFDMLGIQAKTQKKAAEAAMHRNTAIANAKQAMMQLDAAPAGVADADAVRLARQDLARLLQRPPADATPIQKHVESALQKLQDAQHHLLANSTLTEDQLESVEASLNPPPNDKGPVADAHRQLSQGKIDQAMDSLTQAVDQFSKMTPQQQQQAVQQMSNLAHQLQQQANNPKTQQNIQQQLQTMGANQQQAQQMSKLMQQAAQGNQQAGQQLQQMANQLIQQANSKSGQSQQQQQQNAQAMQQAMQQMQQQANGQSQAQQLSQSTQQLAQAMRQAAQAGQQKPGGQKPGNQQGQQQMAGAGQQMQQALQQLKAMANGAQASAAGQQQNQNPGGQQPGAPQARQITENGYGFQRAGLSYRPPSDAGPHTVTPGLTPNDPNTNGRLLASSYVKDNAPIKGDSKENLAKVAESAEQDATDEVDEDRIPRDAQNAVKEYFQTLKQDGGSSK